MASYNEINPGSEPINARSTQRGTPQMGEEGIKGELRQRISQVGHSMQEIGRVATDVAQESLNHLKDNASEYYKKGVEKAGHLEKNMEQRIHQHPLVSVLVAAFFGLILGALWKKS